MNPDLRCLCGADDCPMCFPQPQVEREREYDNDDWLHYVPDK